MTEKGYEELFRRVAKEKVCLSYNHLDECFDVSSCPWLWKGWMALDRDPVRALIKARERECWRKLRR